MADRIVSHLFPEPKAFERRGRPRRLAESDAAITLTGSPEEGASRAAV